MLTDGNETVRSTLATSVQVGQYLRGRNFEADAIIVCQRHVSSISDSGCGWLTALYDDRDVGGVIWRTAVK